jgi:Tol biopolymer transport system component
VLPTLFSMFARKLAVFMVAIVAAFCVLGSGGAGTKDRWVVFAASPGHGTQSPQLFRVRISGSGLEQITTGRHVATDPAFAGDGRHVAFARLSSGLFVANVDGTGLRRLTGDGGDRFPVYSPNGRLIAFVRAAKSGGYRLWLMNASARRQHRLRLAPVLSAANRPAWTPDGRSLVVATDGAFYKLSATTGRTQRRLMPTYDASLGQLLWTLSPNGRTIAYVGRRAEPTGCQGAACEVFALYLQSVTSSKPKRAIADAGVPGWSRDGGRVAYAYQGGLAVQAVGGGAITTIPVGDAPIDGDSPPAWQPR